MLPNTSCRHQSFIKYGRRKTLTGYRQRFLCKHCGKRFTKPEFKWLHSKPKIVLQALSLYAQGLTLREILIELKQPKSQSTIWNWIVRYARTLFRFVCRLKPKKVFQLHVDELFLRMKKRFYYLFDSIDAETRFSTFTLEMHRSTVNAREIFDKSPEAEFIVTDGLLSYQKYLRKKFSYKWLRSHYYRHHTFKSKHNNNLVERLQSTLRRWLHPKRGFNSLRTGKTMLQFYHIYYNFVRKHSVIQSTPAEKAGVIKYKNKNKWLEIIKRAHGGDYC